MAEIIPYLEFRSDEAFTIKKMSTSASYLWNGTIEYSNDAVNWSEWVKTTVTTPLNSALGSDGEHHLYFRGIGNTTINGSTTSTNGRWYIVGTNIKCIGNIETLLDYQTVLNGEHPTMGSYCYQYMFYGCTGLTQAPTLPATTLASYCYQYMFYSCASLTQAPILPATTLAGSCCQYMFYGCTSLTQAPILPVTTLAGNCYYAMFQNCTSLIQAPELPATALARQCYAYMFYGCTSLTQAFELPVTDLTSANGCYMYMFYNCTSLTQAPRLPATTLADSCYAFMFQNCTSLIQAPELPATTFVTACYQNMFTNCTSLTQAPDLPATNLTGKCYYGMFQGCTKLTQAPELPATTLAIQCYNNMFYGCTSLTQVPTLPATTLAGYCYQSMFQNCTSLIQAPELPATDLANANSCYYYMFSGCTSLTKAPRLPATTLADSCYYGMFNGCTSLIQAPELPATTLVASCYRSMFSGCTKLTSIMTLPATSLMNNCYNGMFNMCSKIKVSTTQSNECRNNFKLPASSATDPVLDMFSNTGGDFTGTPDLNTNYYLNFIDATIKDAMLVVDFTSDASFTISKSSTLTNYLWDGKIEYSYDKVTWGEWDVLKSSLPLSSVLRDDGKYHLYFLGSNNSRLAYAGLNSNNKWVLTSTNGSPIDCHGNLELLLDYQTVHDGGHPTMDTYAFANMFYGNTALRKPPELKSINISNYCYAQMFYGCTNLTEIPDLPATTLANYCYQQMFYNCSKLKISNAQTEQYVTEFRIPSSGTVSNSVTSATDNMFVGTGGSFVGSPVINTAYYVDGYVGNKIYKNVDNYIDFNSDDYFTIAKVANIMSWDGIIEYSTDGYIWYKWLPSRFEVPLDSVLKNDGKYHLYFIGTNNTRIGSPNINSNNKWIITSNTDVKCVGNIESLLDYIQVSNREHPSIGDYCCQYMFSGCTSLTQAPELPATTLANYCYGYMFDGCTSLTQAPALPATVLDTYCYYYMFRGCTSLTQAPELPATTLANYCYYYMFSGCSSLTQAPTLPATTLANYCYGNMFSNCTSLTEAPNLPAIILKERCYTYMFYGCTSLTQAPTLPATTLANHCYYYMFYGCTSLTQPPTLPATTLANYCYYQMFYGCTSLTQPPTLPATTLATSCYQNMFYNCTSLTQAPTLPATALANSCYYYMFSGCTSLTQAPALPATTLTSYCYYGMFNGCTSLTQAPELPATTLATYCYQRMFQGCTNLIQAPALPATTLATYCYSEMFNGCINLIQISELPATTLVSQCYRYIFQNCSKIKVSSTQVGEYQKSYRIPSVGTTTATSTTSYMMNGFAGTGGTYQALMFNSEVYLSTDNSIVYSPTLTIGEGGKYSLRDNIFTPIPDAGYLLKNVIVNGESKGAVSSVEIIELGTTIEVEFAEIITEDDTYKFDITDGTLTITPTVGYVIDDVTVNGVSKGAVNSLPVTVTDSVQVTTRKLPAIPVWFRVPKKTFFAN